jgi:hypothetical protein
MQSDANKPIKLSVLMLRVIMLSDTNKPIKLSVLMLECRGVGTPTLRSFFFSFDERRTNERTSLIGNFGKTDFFQKKKLAPLGY